MSKYLISTTEVYRVDNAAEAKELIEIAKQDNTYVLGKYTSENKERKSKGEVIDEWVKVTLVKKFTDEKDPTDQVSIIYEAE